MFSQALNYLNKQIPESLHLRKSVLQGHRLTSKGTYSYSGTTVYTQKWAHLNNKRTLKIGAYGPCSHFVFKK